jgi:hypothetical protein
MQTGIKIQSVLNSSFFNRTLAHVDGNKFGKDLGIPGFVDIC